MRRLIALLFCLIIATPAFAADPPAAPAVKGLWLLTDYPSQTVRPGEVANVRFKLQNAGLAPESLALSVDGVPKGWKADILGGGQPVAAAMPGINESASLQLRVDVPKDAKPGSQTLTINAKGATQSINLPVTPGVAQPRYAGDDPALGHGDCLVDADFGRVDGRLSTRLAEVRRAVDAAAEGAA